MIRQRAEPLSLSLSLSVWVRQMDPTTAHSASNYFSANTMSCCYSSSLLLLLLLSLKPRGVQKRISHSCVSAPGTDGTTAKSRGSLKGSNQRQLLENGQRNDHHQLQRRTQKCSRGRIEKRCGHSQIMIQSSSLGSERGEKTSSFSYKKRWPKLIFTW